MEGSQNNNSNNFSASFDHMSYGYHPYNRTTSVPIPATINQIPHIAISPTPFQNNQVNEGFQGSVSENRSHPNNPHSLARSTNVRPDIDLNQPATTDSDNFSDPLVISSGVSGYEVEEADGQRISSKRKAPEESLTIGESSRSAGQTSRLTVENEQQQQQQQQEDNVNGDNRARPIVLGLVAPTPATQHNRQENGQRSRIRAHDRVRRHPNYRNTMAQGVNYAQPPQPIMYPCELVPGAFHILSPRPLHLPIPNPVIPRYSQPMQRSSWNNANYVVPVPSPVQLVRAQGNVDGHLVQQQQQQQYIIPGGADEAQARANHYPQHLRISVVGGVMDNGMSSGFVATRQTPVPREREIGAERTSDRILAEARETLAMIRNALVTYQSTINGGNEEQVHDHEAIEQDADEMSFEEFEVAETNGSTSGGVSEDWILVYVRPHKYDSAAGASSSQNDTCCICQDEYADGQEVTTLHCGHGYHFECIKQWLMRKNNCPICKRIPIPI